MNKAKRKRLESKGFKAASVQEFLNLSAREAADIELKLERGRKPQCKEK